MTTVAFGPLSYAIDGAAVPAEWNAFRASRSAQTRDVVVTQARPTIAPTFEVAHVACYRTRDADVVVHPSSIAPDAALANVLWQLVATDATALGLIVVHAAAVRVGDSVALLVARPGVGKTTRAVAAGDAAFAYCSVLVDVGAASCVWALPFSGGGDPPIRDTHQRALATIAALERAASVSIERRTGAAATVPVVSALPDVIDTTAHRKAVDLALELAARVPVVTLGSPPDASYLAPLRSWLDGRARSP